MRDKPPTPPPAASVLNMALALLAVHGENASRIACCSLQMCLERGQLKAAAQWREIRDICADTYREQGAPCAALAQRETVPASLH